jgi:hypothetical protein
MANDQVQVHVRDYLSVACTVSGNYGDHWLLGNSASNSLSLILAKFSNFFSMYRYFRLDQLKISYRPTVAWDATGWMALALDPNPRAGTPANLAGVARHSVSVVSDVKHPCELIIKGSDLHQALGNRGSWLVTDTTADAEWRAGGTLQVRTESGYTAITDIGVLTFEAVASFRGLTAV